MAGMFRCCFTIWQYAYLFWFPVSSYAQPPPSVLRTSPIVGEQIYYNCGLFMVAVINLHSFDIFLTGMCVFLSLSFSISFLQRWQRRWFVLYDDGELTYSVDEHVSINALSID